MTKRSLQKEIGQNIFRIRCKRGMTREQLAEDAGISPQFLANLECGNKMLSVQTLRKLSDSLSISADALIYGTSKDTSLESIEAMLRDQPDDILHYIEDLIYFTLKHLPASSENADSTSFREVQNTDECPV